MRLTKVLAKAGRDDETSTADH